MVKTRFGGGASALAVALALGCSGSVAAAETIKIGIPVGLSGANSVVAPSVVQAAELAAAEINQAGGVLGRQLEFVVTDDGSGAQGAQKAFDSLVFQKKVDVLISMETSAARNAGLPIVNRGRVPFIYTSFYEGRSCNPGSTSTPGCRISKSPRSSTISWPTTAPRHSS